MEVLNSFVICSGFGYTLLKVSARYPSVSDSVRAIISSSICALVYDVVFRNIKPNGPTPNSFRNVRGPGLCYLFLVPVAFLVSLPFDEREDAYTSVMVHVTVCLVTMSVMHQFLILLNLNRTAAQRRIKVWQIVAILPWLLTLVVQLAHAWLHLGYVSAVVMYLGLAVACLFQWEIVRCVPRSFTLSEGAILFQALFLFLCQMVKMVWSLSVAGTTQHSSDVDSFTNVAVFSAIVVFVLLRLFAKLRTSVMFFVTVVSVMLAVSLPLLFISLKQNFVVWMFNFIRSDSKRKILFSFWAMICVLCVALVTFIYWVKCSQQSSLNNRNARTRGEADAQQGVQNEVQPSVSTSVRKVFHLVAILAFGPGLRDDISFLNCAATCACVVFAMLECMRVLHVYPFASILEQYLKIFRDKQDQGELILTPIFLLGGFTLPLWLNKKSEISLGLYSGFIALGVGDTAASVIGSKLGQTKWPNSSRSVEGTGAFVISCLVCVMWLNYTSLHLQQARFDVVLTMILTGFLEAFTSQIDNLVLPLFMYVMLAC